jgi:hypothetical protein
VHGALRIADHRGPQALDVKLEVMRSADERDAIWAQPQYASERVDRAHSGLFVVTVRTRRASPSEASATGTWATAGCRVEAPAPLGHGLPVRRGRQDPLPVRQGRAEEHSAHVADGEPYGAVGLPGGDAAHVGGCTRSSRAAFCCVIQASAWWLRVSTVALACGAVARS